jgi:hypothetical protein
MFAGSFGGPVIYENAAYVSPNMVSLPVRQMRGALACTKFESLGSGGVSLMLSEVVWE